MAGVETSEPDRPGAAQTGATIWILPGRRGIGLHRPVGPPPIAILIGAPAGLDRDPISSRSEDGRGVQVYPKDPGVIEIRLTRCVVDRCPGKTAIILVEGDVK